MKEKERVAAFVRGPKVTARGMWIFNQSEDASKCQVVLSMKQRSTATDQSCTDTVKLTPFTDSLAR